MPDEPDSIENSFIPWVEKYRPHKLADIIGQPTIIPRLQAYVAARNCPHMLFAGRAGVGKTSAVLAMANELYGDDVRECFRELNASDARGIDTIRGQVKDFARSIALARVPFKLILLDEADALTDDAQQALRRTMEAYSKHTRFILSCVSPESKIVLPNEVEMTIGEFERHREQGLVSIDEANHSPVREKAVHYTKLNPQAEGRKTLRIESMSGRSLELTADHKLLTKTGWREAGTLRAGDQLLVYPSLEGTSLEKNDGSIVAIDRFKEFLNQCEKRSGKSESATRFRGLPTISKEKIIARIKELKALCDVSLTPREKKAYSLILQKPGISRFTIQQAMGLSRIRVVQLLQSLEKKAYVKRERRGKMHFFQPLRQTINDVRNEVDIRRKIEVEFGISISYRTVQNVVLGKRNTHYLSGFALSELQKKGLLSSRYSDSCAPILARLSGMLLGDGHITAGGRLIFTSDRESLEEVRRDLIQLGFQPSPVFSKDMRNTMRGREFTGTTTWCFVDSLPLARLFKFLGIPTGDKCAQEFTVPPWVIDGTRLVKREFLRALLGCEMNTPVSRKSKVFEALVFRQNKAMELAEGAREFMHQLMRLLEEFGVKSTELFPREVAQRKSGTRMVESGFWISTENNNYHRFLSRIGFTYAVRKEREARLASEYLRHKLAVIQSLQEKGALAVQLFRSGGRTKTEIARSLNCSVDFVSHQLEGKEAGLMHDFPTFTEWRSRYSHGDSSLVWNDISEIKEIELSDVRDVTCENIHNFIANGFVSHNCNYSSKIIEPIQSRCAVFRFRAFTDDDIRSIIARVVAGEKLKVDEKAVEALVYLAEGDARRVINALQGAAALSPHIKEADVLSVASRARPQEIESMVQLALGGKFGDARSALDDILARYGMSGPEVLAQVYRCITRMPLADAQKVSLVDRIGEYEFRMVEGADPRIQLEALLAQMTLVGKKTN